MQEGCRCSAIMEGSTGAELSSTGISGAHLKEPLQAHYVAAWRWFTCRVINYSSN